VEFGSIGVNLLRSDLRLEILSPTTRAEAVMGLALTIELPMQKLIDLEVLSRPD